MRFVCLKSSKWVVAILVVTLWHGVVYGVPGISLSPHPAKIGDAITIEVVDSQPVAKIRARRHETAVVWLEQEPNSRSWVGVMPLDHLNTVPGVFQMEVSVFYKDGTKKTYHQDYHVALPENGQAMISIMPNPAADNGVITMYASSGAPVKTVMVNWNNVYSPRLRATGPNTWQGEFNPMDVGLGPGVYKAKAKFFKKDGTYFYKDVTVQIKPVLALQQQQLMDQKIKDAVAKLTIQYAKWRDAQDEYLVVRRALPLTAGDFSNLENQLDQLKRLERLYHDRLSVLDTRLMPKELGAEHGKLLSALADLEQQLGSAINSRITDNQTLRVMAENQTSAPLQNEATLTLLGRVAEYEQRVMQLRFQTIDERYWRADFAHLHLGRGE
ncbi:MAG: hypothetical protein O3A01_08640 [bacterium]|nr:hypothetical protein [bacterium]